MTFCYRAFLSFVFLGLNTIALASSAPAVAPVLKDTDSLSMIAGIKINLPDQKLQQLMDEVKRRIITEEKVFPGICFINKEISLCDLTKLPETYCRFQPVYKPYELWTNGIHSLRAILKYDKYHVGFSLSTFGDPVSISEDEKPQNVLSIGLRRGDTEKSPYRTHELTCASSDKREDLHALTVKDAKDQVGDAIVFLPSSEDKVDTSSGFKPIP